MAIENTTRYIPVSKFDQYHPWPTPQSLRNRYHAAKRGIDPEFLNCIKKVGGRVLVDELAFLTWLKSQAIEVDSTSRESVAAA